MAKDLHFAVCVGIDRYPEFSDLRFARKDAEAVAEWLGDEDGGDLKGENVKVIAARDDEMPENTPREDAVPVRTKVYDTIQKFRNRVKAHVEENPEDWPKSRLYFYVSGHGIGPSTQDAALLMANAGPGNYGENISCAELKKHLGDSQYFAELVIFADCCRDRAPNAPLGVPAWSKEDNDFGEVNAVLGVAADYGGKAYEPSAPESHNPDDFRGYFTVALLEALRGAGSRGTVDTNSVAKHIRERVRELAKKKGKTQTGHIYADAAMPILFGETEDIRLKLTILFETDYTGPASLRDGDNVELDQKEINGSGTQWPVKLSEGLHRVVALAPDAPDLKRGGYFAVIGGEDVVV